MLQKLLLLAVAPLLITGCDSSDSELSFDSGSNNVEDIFINDSALSIGQSSVVSVEFKYDGSDISDGDDLRLVIHLPRGITYLDESAEVDGGGASDDVDVDPVVVPCSDGSTYLDFRLDENDLDSADDPSGDAEARVTLTVFGTEPNASATIEGAAGDAINYGCSRAFPAEASDVVVVR